MSDAAITVILTQLVTILDEQIRRELRLVCGVGKEVKKLRSEFVSIKAVLVDAEKKQVKDQTVTVWLEKIKDVSYDTEDVLSDWFAALRKLEIDKHSASSANKVQSLIKLPRISYNKLIIHHRIATRITKINERLAEIAIERERYNFTVTKGNESSIHNRFKTASFIDTSKVQGRESDESTLITKLTSPKNPGNGLNIVSIVGLGGIGKTSLAQLAYNSAGVNQNFKLKIWVCVSDPFDEVRIAKAILEDISGSQPNISELNTALKRIREQIEKEKFLLVLDDVWTQDFRKWEQLCNSLETGAPGSTILVTTRNQSAANAMRSNYVLHLGVLSDDVSWQLFKKIAFHERSEEDCEGLKDVGRKISDKCKGLPLTVKMVASLMRSKTTLKEWSDVYESEFWEMKEAEQLFPPLMLSYQDLQPLVKRCFSFCAVFPKDHVINADDLIKLWMAQGYLDSAKDTMEKQGQEYLEELTMRSFFQAVKTENSGKRILSVKMHDMVHDLAQYLTKNECSVLEVNSVPEPKIELSQEKARHLTLIRSEDCHFPKVLNVERLRTYWVQSFYNSPPILGQHDRIEAEFFTRLPRLKALDLSRNRIGGLADEIGNLRQLKFLNLSHNPLQELPSNLCDLYNLQTLKLSGCNHLRRLPKEVRKLVNLRHLEIDQTDSLKTLPKGIGKMESLQTMTKFVVNRGKGGKDGDETCDLEDLGKLNNLGGRLKIEGLGHVRSADEAKRGALHEKGHLLHIHMDFGQAGREEVIEALPVHRDVQTLQISSYRGGKLPDWMSLLPNLQKLHLQECSNCVDVPPLGRLPVLETLHIEGMNEVRILGLEFLGVRKGEVLFDGKAAFPSLKQLKFSNMEKWEEWCFHDDHFEVMPKLRCLKVLQCSRLRGVPVILLQKRSIGKLRIEGCPLVPEQYRRETGEELSKISHIRKRTVR